MAYKQARSRPTQHHQNLMYKIIGADQKEYGPVSADQLRQWMAEGRINAQTLVRPEGETEWRPLSTVPEFASTSGTPPVPGPAPIGGREIVPSELILARDYELDIGGCIARSWELVRQNFWPVVGISLLIMVISGIVN